jgi:hypothetical protein
MPEQFKPFEPWMDLVKAANLIIGAATLIYKVYKTLKPLARELACAWQALRGKPCPPSNPQT